MKDLTATKFVKLTEFEGVWRKLKEKNFVFLFMFLLHLGENLLYLSKKLLKTHLRLF